MALTSFTSICPLRTDVEPGAARDALSALPVGTRSPFAASARTHFARLQVIDELCIHGRRPLDHPALIWSNDVDGDVRSYLLDLVRASADAFAPVLRLCAGAPDDPAAHGFVDQATEYLLAHELRVGLAYVNSDGPTAIDIRLAVLRRRRLAGFVLTHQHDAPAIRRAAFLESFASDDEAVAEGGKVDRATSLIRETKVAP